MTRAKYTHPAPPTDHGHDAISVRLSNTSSAYAVGATITHAPAVVVFAPAGRGAHGAARQRETHPTYDDGAALPHVLLASRTSTSAACRRLLRFAHRDSRLHDSLGLMR